MVQLGEDSKPLMLPRVDEFGAGDGVAPVQGHTITLTSVGFLLYGRDGWQEE